MTVDAALAAARAVGVDRLDAQLLLAELLQRPRAWLIAHGEAPLGEAPARRYEALLARRAAGEPLAYLLGRKEFRGLELAVDRRVLVPRPETEHLVDWALELARGPLADRPAPCVVDLGTGSGAIALALRQTLVPAAEVHATDRSAEALAVARDNARRLGLAIACHEGSWWDALPPGRRFDLAVSNPPYVADEDPHLLALHAEPRSALVAGPDGLDDLRTLVAGAPGRLAAGGWLLLEHGHDQGAAVRALLAEAGFRAVETRRDFAGHERCSGGHL